MTTTRRDLFRLVVAATASATLPLPGSSGRVAGSTLTSFPGAAWDELAPPASGWSAQGLASADELARALGTSAYLVVHRGAVVHGFGPLDRPMNLASVRKSALCLLYGIEIERGRIDLERTLGHLGITDKGGLSQVEKTATTRQLLQSRSGVYHAAAYETAAMKAERPLRNSHAPGSFWYYNNWDFNALGTIFEKLTRRDVFAAFQDELAAPLGFQDFVAARDTRWESDFGSDHPAYVLRLSARDLARVGVLIARGGRWQDRRLIPKTWIEESTTSYSDVGPGLGYGYLWWVGRDHRHFGQRFPGTVFSARGNFGQFLLVDPARDFVVVHRVDMDRLFKREVTPVRFGELLGSILASAPGDFSS